MVGSMLHKALRSLKNWVLLAARHIETGKLLSRVTPAVQAVVVRGPPRQNDA